MAFTYQRIGNEFLVNGTTAGRQRAGSATFLESGGFVITWVDEAGPDFMEVRAQLYDASGTPGGGEFLVNSVSTNDQDMVSTTALAFGGFLVTWRDNSGVGGDADASAIKAQFFNAAGVKLGGELLVNSDTAGGQRLPDAVQLASGDIVIAWDTGGIAGDVKAQLFTAAGVRIGGEFLVNTSIAGLQMDPAVAALPSGGFVISWTDHAGQADDANAAVRAQIYDSAGARVGPEMLVNTTTSGYQQQSDVAALASGGFVVVWEDFGGHCWAQMFDSSGDKAGGEISLETVLNSSQSFPTVSALAFGGFAVTWSESGKDGSFDGIIVQLFDETGARLGTEMVVNQVTANIQSNPVITTLPSGDVVIAWSDFSETGGDASQIGVKAQILRLLIQGIESGDALAGTAGDDVIAGLAGNDVLTGLGGDDRLYGGLGADTASYAGAASGVTVSLAVSGPQDSLGAGIDTLIDIENLTGSAHADTLTGDDGDNRIDGGAGADAMTGGLGNDVYVIDDSGDVVTELDGQGIDEIRTNLGSKAAPFYRVYVLPDHVENFTGTSAGAQGMRANALDNVVNMGAGHDLVVLDDGGVDSVNGGAGNDFFYYGAALTSADITDGGAGVDTIGLLGDYGSGITFTAANLIGVERLALYTGGGGFDNFSYSVTMSDAAVAAGVNFFVTAASLKSTETLFFNGSAETDGSFTVLGGNAYDTIVGGRRADFLAGKAGRDTIYGLAGDDFIYGGFGGDLLYGGGGYDAFRYDDFEESAYGGEDYILDFTSIDRIDLSAIDANADAADGDSAFIFIGAAAFTNVAGQLRVRDSGGIWIAEGDVDGDGVADLIINVDITDPTLPALGAADFIL